MTPAPLPEGTRQSLALLSEHAARQVQVQLVALLQELGRPLSRTARLLRTKAGWQPALRSLLISDLYGTDTAGALTSESAAQRFERLLTLLVLAWPAARNDSRLAGVAAQLATIANLEPAVRGRDDAATGQALGAAISIELLLQELLQDLESIHPAVLRSGHTAL